MIAAAEAYLLAVATRSNRSRSIGEQIAHRMLNGSEESIEALAGHAGLGPRQLRRIFLERTGVGPRLFGRIVRFDRMVRVGNRQPDADWLSLAIDAGYYDHQHMARDFRQFTGLSPTRFAEMERIAPERGFGECER